MSERPIFLLVDGHAVIYRAFYAFPKLTNSQGKLVNAVYGFSRILLTAIRNFKPEYLAVTFDHPEKTFRHVEYEEYKAHRPEMPDELKPQISIIKQVVESLSIPQFELAGYEADDLIGAISCKLNDVAEVLTVIVTGDKDTLQLVDHNTEVWIPGRGQRQKDVRYDPKTVKEKLGLEPAQVIDLKALMGDASDNIPGVKGVGPKTATKLLQAFGSVENVYQAVELLEIDEAKAKKKYRPEALELLQGALLKRLKNEKETAFLSKQLATIDCQIPLEFNLEACRVSSYDKEEVVKLFQELDFKSLISLLPNDEFETSVQEALF